MDLKRFTAPKELSSFDLLAPLEVSIEEVGVKVLEEELELEAEKRLKGRRSRLGFLRRGSGGARFLLSRIELEDECFDDMGD